VNHCEMCPTVVAMSVVTGSNAIEHAPVNTSVQPQSVVVLLMRMSSELTESIFSTALCTVAHTSQQ
jgi:hypothetical protein